MAEAATSASETPPLLVASIDFGTTYSGCAFSFKSDFDKNPCEVSCVNIKYGEKQGFQAERVPTCILFSPDRQFHSFGFDAKTAYCKLADEYKEKAKDWYFFEQFKMRLKTTRLSRDLDMLDQTQKKSMKAMDVIAEAIRFLKDLLLRELQARGFHAEASDIVWVLTVPAIWDDAARQFMREAAEMAGIKSDRLRLALEPEAAAMFCHFHFLSGKEVFAERGKRFMAVDCGGGTVDISVLEVAEQGKLKQLHKPHGAACGGTKVDDAFWRLLSEILGREGTASINNMEIVELMQNFELAKCQMETLSSRVGVNLPESLKEAVEIHLDESTYASRIGRMGSKIRLPKDLYTTFFEESKNGIIKAMEQVLSSENVSLVDVILLVGGLAKSSIIEKAVKAAFPDRRVLVPPSPDLTVLMGAVQFGHCPQAIATRVSPYTYGISTTHESRPGDDPSKVETVDGVERTKDIFEVLIKVNERVSIDQEKKQFTFKPTQTDQKKMKLDLYRTFSPDPKYVTDAGCEKVASMQVDMPDTTGDKRRRVQVSLYVNGTELRVVAKDETTGREFPAKCDFLENKAMS